MMYILIFSIRFFFFYTNNFYNFMTVMRDTVIKQIYLTNILRELLVNHLTWMTNYGTY